MARRYSLTARDIVAISNNPTCQRLIRLRALDINEKEGLRLLTGKDLQDQRGERTAALRHGKVFDDHLLQDEGAALSGALASVHPIELQHVTVLNVEEARKRHPSRGLEVAVHLTLRAIETAATAGQPIGMLLQPALQFNIPGVGASIIRPDAMVFDPQTRSYWPLEAKAIPAVDGAIDGAKRRTLRLQAAVQLLALEQSQERLHLDLPVPTKAILLVASPFAMKPAPAILERLDMERKTIIRALAAISEEAPRLAHHLEARTYDTALRDAEFHFQESCHVGCGLAAVCRPAKGPATLGDTATEILPETISGQSLETVKRDHPDVHAILLDVLALYGPRELHGAC